MNEEKNSWINFLWLTERTLTLKHQRFKIGVRILQQFCTESARSGRVSAPFLPVDFFNISLKRESTAIRNLCVACVTLALRISKNWTLLHNLSNSADVRTPTRR